MSVHPRTPQTPLTVPPRVRCLFYHPSPLLKPPFRESTRNSYRSADEFEVLRILRGVLLTTDRLSFSLPLSVSLSLSLFLFLFLCGRVSSTFETERSTSRSLAARDPRDPPLEDESQCIELRTERYFGSIERDTGLYGGVYF